MSEHHTIAEYIEAIKESGGFMSKVAESLGLTRGAVSKRISESKELQEVMRDTQEKLLDFAESKLINLVTLNDFKAIKFFLACKGKHRGYVERQEVTGADGKEITLNFVPAEQLVGKKGE